MASSSELIRYGLRRISLGFLLAAKSDRGLCAVLLGDTSEQLSSELQCLFQQTTLVQSETDVEDIMSSLTRHIEEGHQARSVPLDLRGTPFQQRVWQALLELPPGATVSYTELATRVGAPGSIRAVAGAVAANRLAVVVPCHRVVRIDGKLCGYRWGLERKRALLAREAVHATFRLAP